MPSSISLNTGLRALLSARSALDTVGHNIANANTPGYSRQRVDLSAAHPVTIRGLSIGSGVDATSINRSIDQLLERRLLGQHSLSGELNARLGGLSELEFVLNDPEADVGADLDALFAAFSELSTAPEDIVLKAGVIQSADTLSQRLRELTGGVRSVAGDAVQQAELQALEVNRLAREIGDLNKKVAASESSGYPANDLRDQRDRALRDLSGFVHIQTVDDPSGAVRVTLAGNTLVGLDAFNQVEIDRDEKGVPGLRIEGATGFIDMPSGFGGSLTGLLEFGAGSGGEIQAQLDELARGLMLELNRVHATGIPEGGPFEDLRAAHAFEDADGDGQLEDELLIHAGLPFDVQSGSLIVNVSDQSTGAISRHAVDISRTHTTVGELVETLNDIPNLAASLDASGRLRISSSSGFAFDFSNRVDTIADAEGLFGSGKASFGSAISEPFGLSDGQTLDLTFDPNGAASSFQIQFDTSSFREISQATADEVAAAINADPNTAANGVEAHALEGQIFLATAGSGAGLELRLDGGSAVIALGFLNQAGQTVSGSDNSVDPVLAGAYAGTEDATFTFRPNIDGTIGTTPGLEIEVLDADGQVIDSLDVGEGYQPGTSLTVLEGVTVSFGLGTLSATNNDAFTAEFVGNSDTSDFLVAAGLNVFLTGSDASDIAVNSELQRDPGLFAASRSGADGDSSLILDFLDLDQNGFASLDGTSPRDFFTRLSTDVAFDVSATQSAAESNASLLENLQGRREAISGVNVDEELVDLVAFEQAFNTASQFISVINDLNDELLNLL